MKLLTVDIGTGTQDIYLYDSRLDLENGYKLVLPSPTMIVYRQLRQATIQKKAVILTGMIMGGGPSGWAAEAHAQAGLPIFATPDAARTLNDDLSRVEATGIRVISEDEAASLPEDFVRLELCDFNFPAIQAAFTAFGVSLTDLDAAAVAVFDHGDAPPQVSDRQFRFDFLDKRLRQVNRLSAFAYPADQVPPFLTRMLAVAQSAKELDFPLVVMDTAPAAVLGAMYDPKVRAKKRVMVVNVGNFHTLAFRLGPTGIEGTFEHHTGFLDMQRLERLLISLANGSLTHAEVFGSMGHGALIFEPTPFPLTDPDFNIVVTGPRRGMLAGSDLRPHFAVPFGDMMITGCFGLVAAVADVLPEFRDEIQSTLNRTRDSGVPPWELE